MLLGNFAKQTNCRAPAKLAGRRRAGPLHLLRAAGRRGLLPASRSRSPAARPPGLARSPPPPPRAPTCWSPPRAGQRRQAAEDAPGRSPTPPVPGRVGPHGPRRLPASLASPTRPYRRAQGEGWRGPAPQAEDAPRGARDPGRPGRGTRAADGRGGGEAAGGDVRGWEAGPTISSSPGAEGEREVPKAPPPSALPPRRLSAAGSRHDAKTAIERNRLRRAAPPRSPSPPPPERRHRLGSLPFPARGGGAHAGPFRRRASAGRGGAGQGGAGRWCPPLGEATRSSRASACALLTRATSGFRLGLPEMGAEVTAPIRRDPKRRPRTAGVGDGRRALGVRSPAGAAASPGQLGNYWATLSPPAAILA
ncbi:collagen alpha-1(I) chain-like [Rattus norvegicus]|uniref:collagen alpha-1(I) chain-like n=1 Tax=Rattus norvegicus TaxID=10116 RepID=UPI002FD7BBF2